MLIVLVVVVAFPNKVAVSDPVGVPPKLNVVAAPAKFTVVAVVLNKSKDVLVVVIAGVLIVVLAPASVDPIINVVAAPAKLTVVAMLLIKLNVDVPAIKEVLIVGDDPVI
jgi:hypothetical protein